MTISLHKIVERLDEIREEFCPSSLEDLQAAIDAGYNDLCGCAICDLCRDLLIAEINENRKREEYSDENRKKWNIQEGFYLLEEGAWSVALVLEDMLVPTDPAASINIPAEQINDLIKVLEEARSHFATKDQKRLDQKRLDRWGQAKTPTAVRPAFGVLQRGSEGETE